MSDNSNVIYHVLELEGNTNVKPEQGQSQGRLWVRTVLNTDGHLKTKQQDNRSQINQRERVDQRLEITKRVCGESTHCCNSGHSFSPSLLKNEYI